MKYDRNTHCALSLLEIFECIQVSLIISIPDMDVIFNRLY